MEHAFALALAPAMEELGNLRFSGTSATTRRNAPQRDARLPLASTLHGDCVRIIHDRVASTEEARTAARYHVEGGAFSTEDLADRGLPRDKYADSHSAAIWLQYFSRTIAYGLAVATERKSILESILDTYRAHMLYWQSSDLDWIVLAPVYHIRPQSLDPIQLAGSWELSMWFGHLPFSPSDPTFDVYFARDKWRSPMMPDAVLYKQFKAPKGEGTFHSWIHRDLQTIITAFRIATHAQVGIRGYCCTPIRVPEFACSIGKWLDVTPVLDISSRITARVLEPGLVADARSLIDALTNTHAKGYSSYLRLALNRFNYSFSRQSHDDCLLDLCIVLESLLLSGVNQELANRLALRAAVLLVDKHNPTRTRKAMRDLYSARSAIVHTGTDIKDQFKGVSRLERKMNQFRIYTCWIIEEYIRRLDRGATPQKVCAELELCLDVLLTKEYRMVMNSYGEVSGMA